MRRSIIALLLIGATACAAEPAVPVDTAPSPPPLAVAAWDGLTVESVCIVGSERYTDVGPGHTPVIDALRAAFGPGPRDDVAADAVESGCDVTLTVAVEGSPLSARYDVPLAGTYFTGADITGTLVMSAPGRADLVASLTNREDPLQTLVVVAGGDPPAEPSQAPFWRTARDCVCGAFQEWFSGTDTFALLSTVLGHWPPDGDCEPCLAVIGP